MAYKKMSQYQMEKFIRQYRNEVTSLWHYVLSLPANVSFQLGQIKYAAQIGHLNPSEMRKLGEVFSILVSQGNTRIKYIGKATNKSNQYIS